MSDHEPFLAMITPVDQDAMPDQGLPDGGPGLWPNPPSVDVPAFPTQLPSDLTKPGTVWPPLNPPSVGGGPSTPPPSVGGGPVTPSGVIVVLAWIPGTGFRWVVVDTGLTVDNTLPTPPPTVGGGPIVPPPTVDNTLPPVTPPPIATAPDQPPIATAPDQPPQVPPVVTPPVAPPDASVTPPIAPTPDPKFTA